MMVEITASVGADGVNRAADVRLVQQLLNRHMNALGLALLLVDDDAGPNVIEAIREYQRQVVGLANPDGRIDPGGRSWKALAAGDALALPPDPGLLSGKAWWLTNQARFPNSAALADLASPFRENVTRFVAALKEAGATVSVSATRRHEGRARLMNACWRVAKGSLKAGDVPAIADCPIQWDHGSPAASRRGAQEMVDMFRIAFQPSLTSLHIKGRAIDMTISWTGTIRVKDAKGNVRPVGAPRNDANPVLHAIGATYGVRKLATDPPHWSDTGH
jgi:peptidoglycan hydrolase-like protein with peptidoglycan-binding domain